MNFTFQIITMQGLIFLVLFLSEIFHLVAHTAVCFKLWKPYLKELQDLGHYFVWDCFSAFFSFVVTRERFLLPLALFHFIVHLYYVITWNKSFYAVRIRDWSAKEYIGTRFTSDFLLTITDMSMHLAMIYCLLPKIATSYSF